VVRDNQYSMADATEEEKRAGKPFVEGWQGSLRNKPSLFMLGGVWLDNGQYMYGEWLYDRSANWKIVMHSSAACALMSPPHPPVVAEQPSVPPESEQTAPPPVSNNVPIYLDNGGRSVWVDVQLGSLTQRMLIDTGATNISIQKSVANNLLRRGEASLEDPGQFTIADGSTHVESLIRIDTVRVGNRVLHDVIAGVMPEGAEPLLGFPVLNQAGRFTIDTKNRQLIFD
jgi:aspartyl protease family protein